MTNVSAMFKTPIAVIALITGGRVAAQFEYAHQIIRARNANAGMVQLRAYGAQLGMK